MIDAIVHVTDEKGVIAGQASFIPGLYNIPYYLLDIPEHVRECGGSFGPGGVQVFHETVELKLKFDKRKDLIKHAENIGYRIPSWESK